MKWRLGYGLEHPDLTNGQMQVIQDKNYEDEKGSEKLWAEFLMLY